MIPAAQIAELSGALGTASDLARVTTAIQSLNQDLMDPKATFSREALVRAFRALGSLSAALLCMDRVTRAMLARNSGGAVNCVG
jgi:hypothetical protein